MNNNIDYIQILSNYLHEDTLLNLYLMTNDKYYYDLAEKRLNNKIINLNYLQCSGHNVITINNFTLNYFRCSEKTINITVSDNYFNKIHTILFGTQMFILYVMIEDIESYTKLLNKFKNTFAEFIINKITIQNKYKTNISLKIHNYQRLNIYTSSFSYYDNGHLYKLI